MEESRNKDVANLYDGVDDSDNIIQVFHGLEEVLSELDFETDIDKALCRDIIESLERNTASYVDDEHEVAIPYMGRIRLRATHLQIAKRLSEVKEDEEFEYLDDKEKRIRLKAAVVTGRRESQLKALADNLRRKRENKNVKRYEELAIKHGADWLNAYKSFMTYSLNITPSEEYDERYL